MSEPKRQKHGQDARGTRGQDGHAIHGRNACATPLTDAQRQAAVERIHQNLALRSGAGCGKTLVLARRFTELLMSHQDPAAAMSRLVALTFTDKAALEMTQRVRKMLADFAAAATSPADRRKLLEFLEQASEARISTIHGFCAALLRTHAIEAGVDPDFAVCADELLVQRMIAEACDQALLAAVEAGDEGAATLLTHFSYYKIVEMLQTLLSDRTAAQVDEYLDPAKTRQRWADLLAAQREKFWKTLKTDPEFARDLAELESCTFTDKAGKLRAMREAVGALARRLLNDPASRTNETVHQLRQIDVRSTGGSAEAATACRALIRTVRERILLVQSRAPEANALDDQAAAALATLCRLSKDAEQIYRRQKVRAGMLDFCDLLDCTARLLVSTPAVRQQLASQIDQLLIDECQDTDPFQLGMLCLLVGAASGTAVPAVSRTGILPVPEEQQDHGQDARGTHGQDAHATSDANVPAPPLPEEGRLFIVGDAKQSIYRFRGAQVEVFEELCNRFGPARQQMLDISFRTHRAGIAFVNHVFEKLMPAYQPTRSSRAVQPPQAAVEVLLATRDPEFETAADASDAQAALTARRIRRMLDDGEKIVYDGKAQAWRPVRAGDIAILFARMTNSLEYERQLAALDIPYYVVAGTGFFQQQEVLDLLNALRVIDNPEDDIALAGVLRSSLVGLDDNALMHVARLGKRPWFEALRQSPPPSLPPEQAQALRDAVELLAKLHQCKDAITPDEVLQAVLDATGYEAVLLASPTGRRMLGNVRLLLEQARAAAAGALPLAAFIAQMDEMVINESRYEQAAVAGEREDVVRLMTIHKAKGLEFPVVFVPDLNAARQGVRGTLLNRADWGLTLKLAPAGTEEDGNGPNGEEEENGGDLPASYQAARAMEREDQQTEDIRKYYVALTRHEDHLVLVGADWRGKEGQFRSSSSFLANLSGVLDLDSPGESEVAHESADGEEYACKVAVKHERVRAGPVFSRPRAAPTPGQLLLRHASTPEQLAANIATAMANSSAPELLGPLAATPSNVQVAVTGLCDFERCPMLFHWRYDLGVPELFLRGTSERDVPVRAACGEDVPSSLLGDVKTKKQQRNSEDTGGTPVPLLLDAATAGTIFHRCMELLDFQAPPSPGESLRLVQRVLAEMGMQEQADDAALATELDDMLARLRTHEVYAAVRAAARVDRELSFVTQAPGLVLRGQIDLIYQDTAGAWHIVDYKSNRIGEEGVAPHAAQYELQMMVYALAARGHVGVAPSEATLYFLRAGQSHVFPITPEACDKAMSRVGNLASELARARRTGRFPQRKCEDCAYCQYQPLCERNPWILHVE